MSAPDVTVIIPVYNTMPYLTACLDSLVSQSIGLDRVEIIAVDDGSTDGSSEEVDRFEREFPGVVKGIHQPNSGGPAGPCNRGLEIATGRYVYFVGADDYLGSEALERLVGAADEYESDVVMGKITGAGGRKVAKGVFAEPGPDVDLFDSRLPYAMGNVKLFRRVVVEELGLRFPEDMPMGSDQPFTFEALLHSGRTTVLADYDYYFAVRRDDSANITFSANDLKRVECAARIMDFIAGLLEPGSRRDAVLRRHFDWELAESLQLSFLEAPDADRRAVCSLIGRLSRDYLTEDILRELPVARRVRLRLAADGRLDELDSFIRSEFGPGAVMPPFVVDGESLYMAYPGFGADPDELYEVHHRRMGKAIAKRSEVVPNKDGVVTADLPVVARTGACNVQLLDGDTVVAEAPLAASSATSSRVRLAAESASTLRIPVAGLDVDIPLGVPAPRPTLGSRIRGRLKRR